MVEQEIAEPAVNTGIQAGFDAHCRRVAAWSVEIEQALQRSPGEKLQLPEIMELAEALDESFEWEPFQDPDAEPDPFSEFARESIRMATNDELLAAVASLPVFPEAAQRALRVLSKDDWTAAEIAAIARSDQALAAQLIGAANSWIYSPVQPVRTLPSAISYIGASRASRILCAASMRPLFTSRGLRDIWNHSLEAAQAAQAIGHAAGGIDLAEAFLAGLVHDIGRLAIATLPGDFQAHYARLSEECVPVQAETALCGMNHAAAGAIALRKWNFDPAMVEAVEFHHQPERHESKLAALLYLTEHWMNSCEDLPSVLRLKLSLYRLGLKASTLNDLGVAADRTLNGLRFAA